MKRSALGLLAHRHHFRRVPRRRDRPQPSRLFLCQRSGSSGNGGRAGNEHHRCHAVQHADGLGPARRAHQHRQAHHGEISDSSAWEFCWRCPTPELVSLYAGFFLYGIGMGGTAILAEMIWANYFGRTSLGKIRGMGSLDHQRLLRRRPAVFRPDVRRHAKL